MKRLAVVLFFSMCAFAVKHRDWQDATLVSIRSQSTSQGIAVIPVGTVIAGVPMRRLDTWYRFDTDKMEYILYVKQRRKPLNLTVYGKTKIAIEGTKAYLIDDAGKEIKLPVVQKIAK